MKKDKLNLHKDKVINVLQGIGRGSQDVVEKPRSAVSSLKKNLMLQS